MVTPWLKSMKIITILAIVSTAFTITEKVSAAQRPSALWCWAEGERHGAPPPEVRDCAGACQGSQAGSEGVPLPLSQDLPSLDRWICPPPLVRALSTSDAFSAVKESRKCPMTTRMRMVVTQQHTAAIYQRFWQVE